MDNNQAYLTMGAEDLSTKYEHVYLSRIAHASRLLVWYTTPIECSTVSRRGRDCIFIYMHELIITPVPIRVRAATNAIQPNSSLQYFGSIHTDKKETHKCIKPVSVDKYHTEACYADGTVF